MFYVWRRNDGLVDWTTFPPKDEGSFRFEILLSTNDEDDARSKVIAERSVGE